LSEKADNLMSVNYTDFVEKKLLLFDFLRSKNKSEPFDFMSAIAFLTYRY
jgi:hypothetical protein